MILQSPAQQLPWWDSQLFGSSIIALIVAFSGWVTRRGINGVRAIAVDTQSTGQKTHTLVNSAMGTQLKINVASAQALYEISGKPEHLALLDDAKTALANHNAKQALVDSQS
jgi:hypothetical protein